MEGIILLKSWPMCHNFPASFHRAGKKVFCYGLVGFFVWFYFSFLILELRLVIIACHCNNWWLNTTEWEEILTQNDNVAAQTDGRKLSALASKWLDKMSQHSQLSPTALAWINLQPPCALRRSLPSSLAVFCLPTICCTFKIDDKNWKKKKEGGTCFSSYNGNKYWHHISEKKVMI